MRLIPPCHDTGIFIHAPVHDFVRVLTDWSQECNIYGPPKRRRLSYEAMWEYLEPRECPNTRAVVMAVGEDWSGFFDNDKYEFPYDSIAYNATRLLRVDAYTFYYDGRPDSPHRGSASFNAYIADNEVGEDGVRNRHVQTLNDPPWKLIQSGEPLPFEDLEAYKRRRVKDRLTLEMLRSYARHLGVRTDEPAAYSEEVFCFGKPTKPPADAATMFEMLNKLAGGRLKWLRRGDG